MTAVLTAVPTPERRPWAEVLAEAVRPEFAVDVYVASPDDPILGEPACRVTGCRQFRRSPAEPFCHQHHTRWNNAGQPSVEAFVAAQVDEPARGRIEKCLVPACRRACRSMRFCTSHLYHWRREQRPDPVPWAVRQKPGPTKRGVCLVEGCEFARPRRTPSRLCDRHLGWFHVAGLDDEAAYAMEAAGLGKVRYDLRPLEGVARLEMQFVLQQRRDDGAAKLPRGHFANLIAAAARVGGSLLDHAEEDWRELLGPPDDLRLVRYAQARLRALRGDIDGTFQDDIWDLQLLLGGRREVALGRRIDFTAIHQPWLRELAKRWARVRLASRAQGVVTSNVSALAKLSRFLNEHAMAPASAKQLRRAHLEAFLGWLPSTGHKQNTLAGVVSSIRTFLNDCAAMGSATGTPVNARIFPGEGPRFHTGLPRFISEDVMSQLEDPANVARWTDPHARNVFLVLRETGKRVSEVVTLERNPILIDSTGAPCLLYHDQKGRRDGIVPISETAAAAIADQQRLVAQRWPTSPWLFPKVKANANGSRHYSSPAFNQQLDRWLTKCDIRGADGEPVKVTSHQFRHTLATRMLNLGVPQHIVQQMLGHVGADTVATYAQLSDATMRAEFERYQHERINIRGEIVTYTDTSPTAEAEWLKHRISKALQTLPNGECGRPIQQACPHPNACLTYDDFLTDRRHLDAHHDQLARTPKLIATADADGNFRMAEMNRQVETNLTHIIDTISSRPLADGAHAAS